MAGFRFETPEEVHAFHAKALALGASCEGPPGERVPDMHFAYFRDLDGNKICTFAFSRVDSEALHNLTVAMAKS